MHHGARDTIVLARKLKQGRSFFIKARGGRAKRAEDVEGRES